MKENGPDLSKPDRPAPESCGCQCVDADDWGPDEMRVDPTACRYPETVEALSASRKALVKAEYDLNECRDALEKIATHKAPVCKYHNEIARAALQPPAVDAGERHCGHSSHDFDPDVMRFECCSGRSCVCKCKPASGGGGEK